MRKRILLVLLALLVLVTFVFVSCKKNDNNDDSGNGTTNTDTSTDAGTNTDTNTDTGAQGCTHAWGQGEITTAPTCRANGTKTFTCSNCGETKAETIYSSKDYCVYGDEPVVIPPDCATETNGVSKYVCTICGSTDEERGEIVIDFEHQYSQEPYVKEATCDEDGYSFTYCTVCFDEEKFLNEDDTTGVDFDTYETIESSGHKEVKVDETPATCQNVSTTYYECENCDYTWEVQGTETLEHDYEGQPEKVQQPTCTENGHKYKECKNCGEKTITGAGIAALGHDTDVNDLANVIRVEPTCSTNGSATPICRRCELTITEEETILYATGEHYKTYYVENGVLVSKDAYEKVGERVEATCHNPAYEVWHCTSDSACQESKNESLLIENPVAQLDHSYVFSSTVEPKCNAIGYDIEVCEYCSLENPLDCKDGCVIHTNEQPQTPHKVSEIILGTYVDSTCQTPARVDYICNDCGESQSYNYPTTEAEAGQEVDGKTFVALKQHIKDDAHVESGDWIRTDVVVDATCTAEGYTVYLCKYDCGEEYHRDYTMITHTFVAHKDGRLECVNCGAKYRDVSTYNPDPIASSKDEGQNALDILDENGEKIGSLDWEVIGYGAPSAPIAIVGDGNEQTIDLTGYNLNIKSGIIKIKLADNLEATIKVNGIDYTIEVEDSVATITAGDRTAKVETSSINVLYIDLYAITEDVTSLTVTSNSATEISLYAKQ